MTKEKNYNIKEKKDENSECFLAVEITQNFLKKFRDSALKSISQEIEIRGFRKGMAPEKMIVERVGEMKIAQEQAYLALNEIIPQIVADEKIDSITNPKIEITKISPSDSLEFKAVFTLMPEVKLPDYKKIAVATESEKKVEVTETEIDEYINYIRKQKAEADFVNKKTTGQKVNEKDKEKLPEFDDDFVKSLGDFKNVADFKKQLKENMLADKKIKEKQNRRIKIIEEIINQAEIKLPEILINEEVERMFRGFKSQIESMKIDFDEYLKQIKKTVDELKKEWRTDAIKRVKMDLILPRIAKAEDLKPDQKKIDHELEHIKEHHKEINEYHARVYITHQLINERVFEFLENLK